MNRALVFVLIIITLSACTQTGRNEKRMPVARAGDAILYYDEIPSALIEDITKPDSILIIHNYINKWARSQLLFQKAESNLTSEVLKEIVKQVEDTRFNLVTHEYQRQMMLEKMDTLIDDKELEAYYSSNENSFILTSNIVKALFIKLPLETPGLDRIKRLARSNSQEDIKDLETLCYQFAEKYDDFDENWITADRLLFELKESIENQEAFLKRNSFYETSNASSVYLVTIFDYRLRGTLSPFDYVKDDIKRIIWNNRRIEFLRSLENGIYNEALKENSFKIY
jgi:hypothetical protein